MAIALTGTTGFIGAAVLGRLGGSPILIGRDATKLAAGFDAREAAYGDPAMTTALAGVDTLFFVSGRESPTRLDEQLAVVASAVTAGVQRIVYLSLLGSGPDCTFTLARQHFFTEEAIRAAGVAFTFLRDSLYLDYLPFMAGEDGVIRGPAGTGRVSAVARDDVADMAATILLSSMNGADAHDGLAYDVTGPEALDLAEVAEQLSVASGRSISFHDETVAEAYESRASSHSPAWQVESWVTSYQSIAAGEVATVSHDVERIVGHPPMTFAAFLQAHPESYSTLPV